MKKKNSKKTKNKPSPSSSSNNGAFTAIVVGFFVLLPLLLFAVLEFSLQSVDYGVATEPFTEMPFAPGIYRDNLDYVFKYHPRTKKSDTTIYRNVFSMPKPSGTIRGIVLGGSTAEGFPYASNHSFSGILETALNQFGAYNYEILNLGFSAMSSYYVRDLAGKILEFDPDFLIVYTGHNEFYGTISRSTGSAHFGNLLNMMLKETRTFQWIFDSLAPAPRESGTLMARQFAGSRYPAENSINSEVTTILQDNMRVVLELAQNAGVPVLMVEPVSNLVDMAPFVDSQGSGLSPEELESGEKILSGSTEEAQLWLANTQAQEKSRTTATGAYLNARALDLVGENSWDYYVLAKDLDPVPFRARTALALGLEELTKEFPAARWLPTSKILLEEFGHGIFSNEIFIDHLHFNHRGQQELARLIAGEIEDLGRLGNLDREAMASFFSQPDAVSQSSFYLSINDYMAHHKIKALVDSAPYTLMSFPYQSPQSQWGVQTQIMEDETLLERLSGSENEDMLDVYSDHLISKGLSQEYLVFMQSFNMINPGSPFTHFSSGRFLASLGTERYDRFAMESFRKAIGFSFDRDQMYRDIRETLSSLGREDLLQLLQQELFG